MSTPAHPSKPHPSHGLEMARQRQVNKVKFFAVLFVLLLNSLFSAELFELSFPVIHYLQRIDLLAAARFLSYQLFYLPVAYLLVSPFILKDKRLALFRVSQATLANWIYGCLKLAYADWRPNYLDPLMVESRYHCDYEYGNPSGHSIGAFCFWFIFANDITAWIDNRYLRKASEVAIKCTAFLICLTRLYFGAHSIDQIIYGMGVGYLVYLIGEMFDRRQIDALFNDMFDRHVRPSILRSPFFWSWFVFNVIGGALFLYRVEQERTTHQYFDAIVNCTRVKDQYLIRFAVTVYEKAFQSGIFMGAIMGMQMKPPSEVSHLWSLHGTTLVVFLWRLVLNATPLILVGQLGGMKLVHPWLMLFKQAVLVPGLGFLYGRYYGIWNKKVWLYKDEDTPGHHKAKGH